ncbi:adenylyltransferase [Methanocalculus chunghsingensis]|uniref:Adenylyltransferase n=1 Tax=Methanocalculus chunghsingensis TaxID=156457 RepID=A0A8J7W9P7_9EURY|nr:HesA/MoeB/ThiF family protein [Methanocalculus chunghsingensis]MBR1368778.1 adenylyltransferase [Methanocalculus chunghsingensis]
MISEQERNRYKRQIMLFGESGQEQLKTATIFIAGAGGLGSPIAIYLAVAGVGRIVLVDKDSVELTNLNRQILHFNRDIGERKTVSASVKLREINPDISIEAIDITIDETNVLDLIGDADGIVDALDNFPTRYLLNKAAYIKEIPFFHGGIRGLCGQATTILPGKTACLACTFPHPPPVEVFPVVGVTPGFIGMVQATEVIKYLTGTGELLLNRLLHWDGERSTVDEIRLEKNPRCHVCGKGDVMGAVDQQDHGWIQ